LISKGCKTYASTAHSPYTPHVNFKAILSFAHKELGCTIPSGHNHVCHEKVIVTAVEVSFRHGSSQSEVRNLEQAGIVQEDICGFQVPVNDVVLFGSKRKRIRFGMIDRPRRAYMMHVRHTVQKLQHIELDQTVRHVQTGILQETTKIMVHVGENQECLQII
jgi:hypothetical protein